LGTVDETPPALAPEGGDDPILLGGPPPLMDPTAGGDPASDPAEVPLEGGGAVVDEGEEAAAIVPSGPSPMQKWNEEWQQVLMERKDAENAKKAEFIAAAEEAMKTFQEQRESKREAKIAKNRQDEQAKLEAIEADLENDNSWQRVCKMVELSHDSASEAADVKRMRDTMILLKNEAARATVLS